MTEIEIDIEKEYFDKIQYDDEYSKNDKGKDTYVAVSPDGSIVATFNSNVSYITITKVATNERTNKSFDKNIFSDDNFLGWSLAVSDIIDNNIVFVAISCITKEDMINPKEIMGIRFYMARDSNQSDLNDSYQYDFIYQFLLSWISSKGTIQLFKFSLDDSTILIENPIHGHGGVIGFLKTSKITTENSVTLVCTNYIGIHKINIRPSDNKFKKCSYLLCSYLLPEILFKKLENVKDAKRNWDYLSKSRYQEFLIVDVNNHQKVQNIEIYDINTLQLVNVFYKYQDSLITRINKPGIFAISTDSRLFAYSYGNNTIAIYLMENGLKVVSKKFDNISKIKLLEFIKKDEKLFIIEEDRGDVKFHVWVISGCLNDYFPIPEDLSYSRVDLLKHNRLIYNSLLRTNGKEIFLDDKDDDDKNQFRILSDIPIKISTFFGDNDNITCENEYDKYNMHELEPWNDKSEDTSDKSEYISGIFLDNDKRFLLIIGQNSIQLWKSKSQNFKDFKDFKNFENSDLVYISINKNPFERIPEFQIKNDMTTVIIDACKSLVYLHILCLNNSCKKCQKYVSGITNIIKDFIKNYPDNWKLMEVQYPLMACLILSRSFSLIKYVLFGDNGQEKNAGFLHIPQNKYGSSYSHYDVDWDLNLNDLNLNYLELNDLELNDLELNDLELNDLKNKLKLNDLNDLNDLELALKLCHGRDAVMLAYLLEYYSENAMNHTGWMSNVIEILPKLPENYSESLFYKPCFGGMKFNLLNKRFKTYDSLKLKVYLPVTRLIEAKSTSFLQYKEIRNEELSNIFIVPFLNFKKTTHDSEVDNEHTHAKDEGKHKMILDFLIRLLLPQGYSNKESSQFLSFLQNNQQKGNSAYFDAPVVEAFTTSRWTQARRHWGTRLMFYTAFLFLFSFLSQLFLSDNDNQNKYNATFMTVVGIFYYVGTYLLIIEFMQMYRFVLLGHPSLFELNPSAPTYTLDNGTTNFTLTGEIPENPFNTIWDAILSAYYWNTIDLSGYDYWPLKLFAFIANVILVLVLLNMIIALMNDAFNKAKEDGIIGLLLFRTDLIHDYESTHYSKLNNGPLYICFDRDSDLIKNWIDKSHKLEGTKLYSWFNDDSMDEENIKFDDENSEDWYKLISGTPYNKYRDISENDIWFLMKESIKFDDEKH
ncbi:unnamed protein product [Rhizophagus irregularis]|nr:unnamed protein product [Rhizophagus irregularis]